MELLDALNWRYAVKQFSEDIIPDAVIAYLIRAYLTTSVVCTLGYRNTSDTHALKPKIRFANSDFVREV